MNIKHYFLAVWGLDFWAIWCDPCRDAVPELRALYEKYHEKGLEIYSVSEDQSKARWKAFIADNGMTWINVLDDNGGRKNSKAWFDYALHGIPTRDGVRLQTSALPTPEKMS
jgi:thiol-disulfide isomerase/thioredoxin